MPTIMEMPPFTSSEPACAANVVALNGELNSPCARYLFLRIIIISRRVSRRRKTLFAAVSRLTKGELPRLYYRGPLKKSGQEGLAPQSHEKFSSRPDLNFCEPLIIPLRDKPLPRAALILQKDVFQPRRAHSGEYLIVFARGYFALKFGG